MNVLTGMPKESAVIVFALATAGPAMATTTAAVAVTIGADGKTCCRSLGWLSYTEKYTIEKLISDPNHNWGISTAEPFMAATTIGGIRLFPSVVCKQVDR